MNRKCNANCCASSLHDQNQIFQVQLLHQLFQIIDVSFQTVIAVFRFIRKAEPHLIDGNHTVMPGKFCNDSPEGKGPHRTCMHQQQHRALAFINIMQTPFSYIQISGFERKKFTERLYRLFSRDVFCFPHCCRSLISSCRSLRSKTFHANLFSGSDGNECGKIRPETEFAVIAYQNLKISC